MIDNDATWVRGFRFGRWIGFWWGCAAGAVGVAFVASIVSAVLR